MFCPMPAVAVVWAAGDDPPGRGWGFGHAFALAAPPFRPLLFAAIWAGGGVPAERGAAAIPLPPPTVAIALCCCWFGCCPE